MSNRTLIEINHDFVAVIEADSASVGHFIADIVAGRAVKRAKDMLANRYGIRVVEEKQP